MRTILVTATLTLALAACGQPEPEPQEDATIAATPAEPSEATARLQTADGTEAGTATASGGMDGVQIVVNVTGMEPGDHGVHVHMTGSCEAPAFESAGGHWNPSEAMHGLEGDPGQHAGDMPNLTVGEDGTGTLTYQLVGGDWEGLMDADGSAFVVHAGADDQMTDPSGDSGDRVACGVFVDS